MLLEFGYQVLGHKCRLVAQTVQGSYKFWRVNFKTYLFFDIVCVCISSMRKPFFEETWMHFGEKIEQFHGLTSQKVIP